MKVQNHDIAAMVRKIRRFEKELTKSVSSGLSELSKFDLERLVSYIAALKAFKAFSVSQPELDLPESSPMELDLGELGTLTNVENDDIAYMLNLTRVIKIELINSQSARRSAGLVSHDSKRMDSFITKLEIFISEYIAENSPLDLPESSPMVEGTGHGNTGI
tara:strand:- start:2133 stop:2618 length:486 start_codon:yes stop_codon:yes gene_type:complete